MVVSLALALFILAAVAVDAFAAFEELHMVGSEGSVVSKETFGWDETPWLYLKLPYAGFNVTGSWWQDPLNKCSFEGSDPSISPVQWLSLSSWDTVKKLGNWSVNAIYFYGGGNFESGAGSTGFAVTPEPVSTILFLTGGMILAVRKLRRKR